jgi:hypothetical protein
LLYKFFGNLLNFWAHLAVLAAKSHGISWAGAIFSRAEPLGTRMDTGFSRLAANLGEREVFMGEGLARPNDNERLCVSTISSLIFIC